MSIQSRKEGDLKALRRRDEEGWKKEEGGYVQQESHRESFLGF